VPLQFKPPVAGSYYVGVSVSNNSTYNPNVAGSGSTFGQVGGTYQLTAERRSATSFANNSELSHISATASRGTAAQGGVASANTGQTITIHGVNLQPMSSLHSTRPVLWSSAR
jgi:hypothetical protein